MKLSMILSQLSTGMAGTISIFVLTLVFFPAARSADRLRAYVEKPDCERNFPALYLP